MVTKGDYSFLGRQVKILCSLPFGPAAQLLSHGIQLNSCSVHLVDIKKEIFNPGDERQSQTRANSNQASDVIGKAD